VLVVGADGKVARKDITTQRQEGQDWIVGSGVSAGDKVIVSGLQRAQPGAPAKAVPWTPEKEAASAASAAAAPQG